MSLSEKVEGGKGALKVLLAAQLLNPLLRCRESTFYSAQWAILAPMAGTGVLATPSASMRSIGQAFCSIQAALAVILGPAPAASGSVLCVAKL